MPFVRPRRSAVRKTVLKELLAIKIFLNAEKEMLVLFILGGVVSVLHILPSFLEVPTGPLY